MAIVNTKFVVPCLIDIAVLAIQDATDRFGWKLIELSQTRIVALYPPRSSFQIYNLPQIILILTEVDSGTEVDVSVSAVGPIWIHGKKRFVGILGQVVNSISIRVQTRSISINPTVAIGDGLGSATSGEVVRVELLERLQILRKDGVLTHDEFEIEKRKVLGHPQI
jgi:hypothetical protein